MKTLTVMTLLTLTASVVSATVARGEAPCSAHNCDVTKFAGTSIDQKIENAIAAASKLPHRTVYFPAGIYNLRKSISLNSAVVNLRLIGHSSQTSILSSAPIVDNGCLGSVINIDRSSGFDIMRLEIDRLGIEMKNTRDTSQFRDGGCSSSGHGIRVGNGWRDGFLKIENTRIMNAPGYGIGVQNGGSTDISANNLWLRSVEIYNSGMDAIDTKRPMGGNKNFDARDLIISEIGFNDERSAAAIDISYDDVYLKGITIITAPRRENPRGMSENTGIRFRTRELSGVKNAIVRELYIKGTTNAVHFDGDEMTHAENVTVKHAIIKSFAGTGIFGRGKNLTFKVGCTSSSDPNSKSFHFPLAAQLPYIRNNMSDDLSDCSDLYEFVGSSKRAE